MPLNTKNTIHLAALMHHKSVPSDALHKARITRTKQALQQMLGDSPAAGRRPVVKICRPMSLQDTRGKWTGTPIIRTRFQIWDNCRASVSHSICQMAQPVNMSPRTLMTHDALQSYVIWLTVQAHKCHGMLSTWIKRIRSLFVCPLVSKWLPTTTSLITQHSGFYRVNPSPDHSQT